MKKILTLMAAMSACAGTAMASDFNFANPTVDAKEDGSALTYNETAKAFSFTVTAEDEITLYSYCCRRQVQSNSRRKIDN